VFRAPGILGSLNDLILSENNYENTELQPVVAIEWFYFSQPLKYDWLVKLKQGKAVAPFL